MKKWKWYYKQGTAFEMFSVLYDKDDYVVVKNDDTDKYSFGLKKDFGTLYGFPVNQSCLTKEEIIKQLNAFIDIDKKYLKECPNDWFVQNINRWQDMISSVEGEGEMRKEMYEELINLGYTPEEALEQISEMEFAEDYED